MILAPKIADNSKCGLNPTAQGRNARECDLTGTDFRLWTKTEIPPLYYYFTSCGRD